MFPEKYSYAGIWAEMEGKHTFESKVQKHQPIRTHCPASHGSKDPPRQETNLGQR
jgi:hypothetical protein